MATREFAAHESHAHAAPQGFIRKWVFSLDHKVIGKQYFALALVAVFIGMFLSWLMRIHMVWPTAKFPLRRYSVPPPNRRRATAIPVVSRR